MFIINCQCQSHLFSSKSSITGSFPNLTSKADSQFPQLGQTNPCPSGTISVPQNSQFIYHHFGEIFLSISEFALDPQAILYQEVSGVWLPKTTQEGKERGIQQ